MIFFRIDLHTSYLIDLIELLLNKKSYIELYLHDCINILLGKGKSHNCSKSFAVENLILHIESLGQSSSEQVASGIMI